MFPFLIKTLTLDQGFKNKTKQTTKKNNSWAAVTISRLGQTWTRQGSDRLWTDEERVRERGIESESKRDVCIARTPDSNASVTESQVSTVIMCLHICYVWSIPCKSYHQMKKEFIWMIFAVVFNYANLKCKIKNRAILCIWEPALN